MLQFYRLSKKYASVFSYMRKKKTGFPVSNIAKYWNDFYSKLLNNNPSFMTKCNVALSILKFWFIECLNMLVF